ncbi:AlbA family DNA-binding domain-containing protein [Paraburkholderia phenazinium]|uniref:Putative DNA-binding domain-containing protein n=1 Tax=Paraburkholderia phenazinium TaxID=60549 RepID=A0A1N6KTG3_9BURK|nr:ATP-binding protein [Paraburkholderia phenazinium]SIO59849.1 Putative DNA-binding domain-containing protein [Paraburkholderia phenazinium]
MPPLDIPLDNITEADLRNLLTMKVGESSYLDYKQQTYGDSGDNRSEFLADVSSFANTLGGDIVIGIEEQDGTPTKLMPFEGDADQETRRLEQIALTGLEPRINHLRIRAIPIASGGHVLVVRIPRSFLPPHRVIARDSNKFWARAGTTKYQPNVHQLRQLFNDAPHMAERIRSFQADRLVKIAAGDTPIPLNQLGKVVVHVIPVPSFADGRLADIVQAIATGTHVPLPPDEIGGSNQTGVNLDGFYNYTNRHEEGTRLAYAQFFRNGAMEGVGELRHEPDGQSRFVGLDFTTLVIKAVRQYLGVLKSYDTGLPVYVFLSLCNATRTVYRYSPEGLGWSETSPIGREIVALPEIYLDNYDVDVPAVLRPVFNVLWNAVGLHRCDMYDSQGEWRGSNVRN